MILKIAAIIIIIGGLAFSQPQPPPPQHCFPNIEACDASGSYNNNLTFFPSLAPLRQLYLNVQILQKDAVPTDVSVHVDGYAYNGSTFSSQYRGIGDGSWNGDTLRFDVAVKFISGTTIIGGGRIKYKGQKRVKTYFSPYIFVENNSLPLPAFDGFVSVIDSNAISFPLGTHSARSFLMKF